MDAHEKALRQPGVSSDAIQTALRFAAIVQSAAVAIETVPGGTHRKWRRNPPPHLSPQSLGRWGRRGCPYPRAEPAESTPVVRTFERRSTFGLWRTGRLRRNELR